MKKLKFAIKDWIFGKLVYLIFKYSNNYKLIKFNRVENDGIIDYDLLIRTKEPTAKSLVDIENQTSEYFNNIAEKNSKSWVNGGFNPNSDINNVKNRNHEFF
jgi:hypothetical protein